MTAPEPNPWKPKLGVVRFYWQAGLIIAVVCAALTPLYERHTISEVAALRDRLAQPHIQRAAMMIESREDDAGRRGSSSGRVSAKVRLEAGTHPQKYVQMNWSRRTFGTLDFDKYESVGRQITVTCLAAQPEECSRVGAGERALAEMLETIPQSRAIFVAAVCVIAALLSQFRRVMAAPPFSATVRVPRRTPQTTASGRSIGRVQASDAGLGRHGPDDRTPDS